MQMADATFFVEVPEPRVRPGYRVACEVALADAQRGPEAVWVPGVRVRWFEPKTPGEFSRTVVFEGSLGWAGAVCSDRADIIWLRPNIAPDALWAIVAHELRHAWQLRWWGVCRSAEEFESRERDAEAYAAAMERARSMTQHAKGVQQR